MTTKLKPTMELRYVTTLGFAEQILQQKFTIVDDEYGAKRGDVWKNIPSVDLVKTQLEIADDN